MNPYSKLPDRQFWRRAVANVDRHEFDPVGDVKFVISSQDRIATAGSCFAQHISRKLDEIGFNYFVTEHGAALPEQERVLRNYRVFSARFGNVYTTRQLSQLFDEAFHVRRPTETTWARADGRLVDPYRPTIEPGGFETSDAVRDSRAEHLNYVRQMFEEADVFVFTLGLTECWLSRADGSAFPVAPGVSGGIFDESLYAFVNLTVAEVEHDLRRFLEALKQINSKIKVLLTVSPVPLVATFENKNVLVATTYSKSVLRVAADTIQKEYSWVDYFPSFEIITGSFNRGLYYAEDAREVNSLGVSHAMRAFLNNYVPDLRRVTKSEPSSIAPVVRTTASSAIICDEEAIDRINI